MKRKFAEYYKLTPCIRHPEGSKHTWRPTASPFIYVSFDYTLLLKAYGYSEHIAQISGYGLRHFKPSILNVI